MLLSASVGGRPMPASRASSLVYHSGAIGDFVTTIPAFQAWRVRHPVERIVLLGRPEIAVLAIDLGLFNDVWDAGSPRFSALFRAAAAPAADLGLDAFTSALIFASASSPLSANLESAGVRGIVRQDPFPPAGALSCPLFAGATSMAAPAPGSPSPREGAHATVHVIDYHLSLFEDLGPDEPRAPLLCFPRAPSGQAAALHPGSGSARKNWPRERFEQLARRLAARGFSIHWILGPAEAPDGRGAPDSRRTWVPPQGTVLHGLSLDEVASFLSKCALFVGNDSGIAHIAAAVRCPVVALFGPTHPGVWVPRGGPVRVCTAPDGKMESIGIDEVMRACDVVLYGSGG